MSATTIPTKDVDFLDEDKPIRGQNYVCLSFLSPEDVLQDKQVFVFQKYLANFSTQLNEMIDNLKSRHPESSDLLQSLKESHSQFFAPSSLQEDFRIFQNLHSSELEKQFHEECDFRTSVRGIKVRGTFDTLKEAQNRAEFLKRTGDKFDIYVAQVGCWCPWSPSPDDMADAEYAETQLNTLMKKYKENLTMRDEVFEERKTRKIEEAKAKKEQQKAPSVDLGAPSVAAGLDGDDIWLSRKDDN